MNNFEELTEEQQNEVILNIGNKLTGQEVWYWEGLVHKLRTLQEENDKLKEQCKQWKENHKAVCIQRDNILNNTVKDIEEQIDYKSRNEKAIEYIKMNKYYEWCTERDEHGNIQSKKIETTLVNGLKLLDILQGVDKE